MENQELTEVIKYISQREEELSNYSDKLRQALVRIFNTFGDPEECQICNTEQDSSQHFEYTTFNERGDHLHINEEKKNELIATGKYIIGEVLGRIRTDDGKIIIERNKDVHTFIPKVRLSLPLRLVLFTSPYEKGDYFEDERYGLASEDSQLWIMYESPNAYQSLEKVNEVSRRVLKELVRSKAISRFLNEYVKLLDQTTKEYQEVSSLAEKLVSVLD